MLTRLAIAAVVGLALAPTVGAADPPAGIEFFERSVRPLLVERCLSCHGPKKQKGGLRLDTREAVLRGGDGGEVVTPGKPGASRLIEALHHTGDTKMPPSGKLPAREVAALEKWVALGLPWPDRLQLAAPDAITRAAKTHWAFQPVRRPAVPACGDGTWARTPIDRFILARLDAAKLRPSPETDRRTQIRRATFDLHGLPPTPAEVAAFVADESPDAYEKLIDRLLASPRYGERWGRHWLDVARYADNKGYVFFEDKSYPWAWTYRDYVIRSFNDDTPYDRFVVEQLAADQLGDPAALPALGFLTVGGHFMNNTHDVIDDRIDVVTRGLMGLTVTCARCHDHKYDPIPAADYYSLYGVFRSCYEPTVPPLVDEPRTALADRMHAAILRSRERALKEFVSAKHRELVTGARRRVAEYLTAVYATRDQPPADDFMLLADRGDLNPTMITRWRQYLDETRQPRDPVWAPWHDLSRLPEKEFAERAAAVLTKAPAGNRFVRQAFASPPKSMKEVADRYAALLKRVASPTPLADPDAEQLRRVLYGPQSPADAPLELDWGFLSLFPDRATQGEYQKLLKDVEGWAAKGPPRAMVLLDSARPYDPRVFERGQPGRPGERVPRQFVAVAHPHRKPFTQGSGRLELAREIVSKDNPLTARVFVNRVWMHHFGSPLVGTPGDFGLRGDPPTHPALLDWLAADFMEHGWSVKRLHRQIMTSATYRQQSLDRPEGTSADPENQLLWKANRRRLEYEALHDAMLAVSGSLDLTVGGSPRSGKRRRAVYEYVDRLEFPSLLSTFDVPNPAATSPLRTATTVPPQALYLMNGPFVRDAAKRLAASVQKTSEPDRRVRALFRACYGREPTDDERKLAAALVAKEPEAERWVDLAHGLLMANEFAFID